jgi:UDP-N-acetylglucosamine--dolichyl-phosphate N-acetylglucosaminephosphotransferase
MIEGVLLISGILSFIVTWIATWKWIRIAPEIGLLAPDMNKPGKPKVPEMGGISVVFGFVMGLLVYIGLKTFYFGSSDYVGILSALCTILMTCIIGMMDDLLGWKKGFKQWQKPIFTLFAAMPMMVINAGHSTMTLPIVGTLDWGIIYPLLIIPIGIVCASNSFNMVAGFNGLETGLGIIILLALGYVAFITDRSSAMVLLLCMIPALAAFLYFNWYPAKVFPGDTMTYSVGALVACIAILGDMQKIAVLLFIPYAVDFFLQLRSRFKAEAFARVNEDGSLEKPCKGIYHMTHLAIAVLKRLKPKVYERDVVILMLAMELIFVGVAFAQYLWKITEITRSGG